MAHEFMSDLQAFTGEQLSFVLPELATGLLTTDLDAVLVVNAGSYVADPVTDLSLALTEVDGTNAPGIYQLSLVPDVEGVLYLRITEAGVEYEYTIQVSAKRPSDPTLEGEYVLTVEDGVGAVEGAVVRVFDAAGTRFITRGTTDAFGNVTFTLPIGNYQIRAFKDGTDFSAINPTTITVTATELTAPILDEVLPLQGSIGDVLVLSGSLFEPTDMQVQFGAEATVAADYVNLAGTLLLVTVPTLTGTVFSLRVDKEDPGAPPARLDSNAITWIRV